MNFDGIIEQIGPIPEWAVRLGYLAFLKDDFVEAMKDAGVILENHVRNRSGMTWAIMTTIFATGAIVDALTRRNQPGGWTLGVASAGDTDGDNSAEMWAARLLAAEEAHRPDMVLGLAENASPGWVGALICELFHLSFRVREWCEEGSTFPFTA